MHQQVVNYGGPAVAGGVMIVGAFVFWAHNHWRPFQWFLFFAGSFGLTLGMTVWLDALIGLTYAGPGLMVLFSLCIWGTYSLGMQWFHRGGKNKRGIARDDQPRRGHGKYRTVITSMVMGTTLAVALASWRSMISNSGKSLVNTGQAIAGQAHDVDSGHALKIARHHNGTDLVLTVVILVLLILLAIYIAERVGHGGGRSRRRRGSRRRGSRRDDRDVDDDDSPRRRAPSRGGSQRRVGGRRTPAAIAASNGNRRSRR